MNLEKIYIQIQGKQYYEVDVLMLPSKETIIDGKHLTLLNLVGKSLEIGNMNDDFHNASFATQQFIYILSNERPRNGDWVIPNNQDYMKPWVFNESPCPMTYWGCADNCKKIIATNDIFINKSLSKLHKSFIDKYVNDFNYGKQIKKAFAEKELEQGSEYINIIELQYNFSIKEVENIMYDAFEAGMNYDNNPEMYPNSHSFVEQNLYKIKK